MLLWNSSSNRLLRMHSELSLQVLLTIDWSLVCLISRPLLGGGNDVLTFKAAVCAWIAGLIKQWTNFDC